MTALDLLDHAIPASVQDASPENPRQSLRKLLLPLVRRVAECSYAWRAESVGYWNADGSRYWMPRLVFKRPGETPEIKVGIFAGVHGDEPAGVFALCDFVRALDTSPVRGRGYELHVYPLVNPTGYEDRTRHARSGKDLNREFWRGSTEPEVALLEKEILRERYHGYISLHSDDTSEGFYGFARGSTLTQYLLRPALATAEAALPVDRRIEIDGFHAEEGIIHTAYDGILSAPPGARPQSFEIILESPTEAPMHLQRGAFLLALVEILTHYRRFIAYGGDL
ncbi:MAG: succinylglutamate desuccinylase/aspartoacylase family protein [Chthoniobacteraceae bacterium]